jgi:hypothetical protein
MSSWRHHVFARRNSFRAAIVSMLLLALLAGCGDDDDDGGDGDRADQAAKPVEGTFVGKVPKTEALVSVVAAPIAKGQDKRGISVFVCDAKSLCESFSGSAAANDFTAAADGGEGQAKGKLSGKTATGTIELSDGETVRYKAATATATAGLYEVTISAGGKLEGASAAGVGLTGKSPLPDPGAGSLKLADGKRIKFEVTESSAADALSLRAGQARLIVSSEYELRGSAKGRRASDGGGSDFFIRSSSG